VEGIYGGGLIGGIFTAENAEIAEDQYGEWVTFEFVGVARV
jgi:hypothetical protein